jgi:hypothetical protein
MPNLFPGPRQWTLLLDRPGGLSGGSTAVTIEATQYLTPLLDAKKDRTEIGTLKARCDWLNALPRYYSPIVVPLRNHLDPGRSETAFRVPNRGDLLSLPDRQLASRPTHLGACRRSLSGRRHPADLLLDTALPRPRGRRTSTLISGVGPSSTSGAS